MDIYLSLRLDIGNWELEIDGRTRYRPSHPVIDRRTRLSTVAPRYRPSTPLLRPLTPSLRPLAPSLRPLAPTPTVAR